MRSDQASSNTGPGGPTARGGGGSMGRPALDSVYSAKSAAALLERLAAAGEGGKGRGAAGGPLLLWSTKSSAPPPLGEVSAPVARPFARWLARGAG